jgi:hypothetical protein
MREYWISKRRLNGGNKDGNIAVSNNQTNYSYNKKIRTVRTLLWSTAHKFNIACRYKQERHTASYTLLGRKYSYISFESWTMFQGRMKRFDFLGTVQISHPAYNIICSRNAGVVCVCVCVCNNGAGNWKNPLAPALVGRLFIFKVSRQQTKCKQIPRNRIRISRVCVKLWPTKSLLFA